MVRSTRHEISIKSHFSFLLPSLSLSTTHLIRLSLSFLHFHINMRTSAILVTALASLASAAPFAGSDEISVMKRSIIEKLSHRSQLTKRQSVTTGASDVRTFRRVSEVHPWLILLCFQQAVVLNFALQLEHLEAFVSCVIFYLLCWKLISHTLKQCLLQRSPREIQFVCLRFRRVHWCLCFARTNQCR